MHSMCQPGRPAPSDAPSHDGSPGRARAPQQAVERMALAGTVRVAAALGEHLEHPRLVEMADRAEPGVGVHCEVDVTVGMPVRRAERR